MTRGLGGHSPIEAMPEAEFESMADVMKAYGEADHPERHVR